MGVNRPHPRYLRSHRAEADIPLKPRPRFPWLAVLRSSTPPEGSPRHRFNLEWVDSSVRIIYRVHFSWRVNC